MPTLGRGYQYSKCCFRGRANVDHPYALQASEHSSSTARDPILNGEQLLGAV